MVAGRRVAQLVRQLRSRVPPALPPPFERSVELWGCLAYSSNANRAPAPIETITWRHKAMILLNNHRYALITGIVLAIILAVLIGGPHFNSLGFARWFHIVSGV